MTTKSSLVIGGSGFLGSHTCRTLDARGHRVEMADLRAPSDLTRHIIGESVPFHEASIEDVDRLVEVMSQVRPRWVVQAAAIVDPGVVRDDPYLAASVNFLGTINVFEAARRVGVERVVFVSSVGVLPPRVEEPIGPDHPLSTPIHGPASGFYGAAKAAAELFALATSDAGRLDVRVVRPSALYGLGMARDLYVRESVEGAVEMRPVRYTHGGLTKRDYTHVSDAADLIALLLESREVEDRVFFAATGGPLVEAKEVVEHVQSLVPGCDVTIDDSMSDVDIIEQRHRGIIDVSNAREQLGWTPQFPTIREGLAQYIEAYKKYRTGSGSAD